MLLYEPLQVNQEIKQCTSNSLCCEKKKKKKKDVTNSSEVPKYNKKFYLEHHLYLI